MMPRISVDEIASCCAKAMVEAFNHYYRISDGAWLLMTPEYWYTTQIAIALGKRKIPLLMEWQVKKMEAESADPVRGRPPLPLRLRGKADIVACWKSDGTPRALIEVKKGWVLSAGCIKDIGRITSVLRRQASNGGSIQFGIFAIATDNRDLGSQTATQHALERRSLKWLETIRAEAGDAFSVSPISEYGKYKAEEGMMGAAVFVIKPRN